MDEGRMIDRAIRAYFMRGQVQQPAREGCEVRALKGRYYVVLRNLAGTLAVYEVHGNPLVEYKLRGLPEWPAQLDDS
jgi:hypothetical protein